MRSNSSQGLDQASEATLAAARIIRRGATSLASRARAERRGVLSLNQTGVLGLLSRAGALTPSEIAEGMHVALQSLTRVLASLQTDGLISRVTDPDDRRQSMITITDAGRTALRSEMQPRDEWIAGVIEQELTEAEREVLVVAAQLMQRLSESGLFPGRREP